MSLISKLFVTVCPLQTGAHPSVTVHTSSEYYRISLQDNESFDVVEGDSLLIVAIKNDYTWLMRGAVWYSAYIFIHTPVWIGHTLHR